MHELPSIHVATEKTPASDENLDCTVSKVPFLQFQVPVILSQLLQKLQKQNETNKQKQVWQQFSPPSINIHSYFIQSINSQLAWKQNPRTGVRKSKSVTQGWLKINQKQRKDRHQGEEELQFLCSQYELVASPVHVSQGLILLDWQDSNSEKNGDFCLQFPMGVYCFSSSGLHRFVFM